MCDKRGIILFMAEKCPLKSKGLRGFEEFWKGGGMEEGNTFGKLFPSCHKKQTYKNREIPPLYLPSVGMTSFLS
jgi:hypothetical protein